MTAVQVKRLGRLWEVSTHCDSLPEAMALVDAILARPEPAAFVPESRTHVQPVEQPGSLDALRIERGGIVEHRKAGEILAARQHDIATDAEVPGCIGGLCPAGSE